MTRLEETPLLHTPHNCHTYFHCCGSWFLIHHLEIQKHKFL
uniref:Uncharacterized protein MANES_10G141000 n=1 Tax=Rhizophora mucronata TaxID=61149 RepID=A0A2P2JLA0_RHIMU